jgi:glycosyltransferase involved in cell wall biosynthesis
VADGGRLRVGVHPVTAQMTPTSGHGRVWSHVLRELSSQVDLAVEEPRKKSMLRRAKQVDVWLVDGHGDTVDTAEPQVSFVHEASWFDPDTVRTTDPAFLAALRARTDAAVARAAHVITASQHARGQISSAYGRGADTVHVVPHGVDPTVYRPLAPGGADLVAAVSGQRAPYVLFAAALHPRKNLAGLRQAFDGLAALSLPHLLVVAGHPAKDRPDTGELEAEAEAPLPSAPGRVVRIRDADDAQIAGLMADCSAFCLPSLSEGFGLTALEAMACGAPVVVSDRGALPEVVGGAGLVVSPDPTSLRAALQRLMTDHALAERLGTAGAARAESFTWAATATGWLRVLSATAAHGG